MNIDYFLPIVFICLVGFASLVYAILDGYDLGVGILFPIKKSDQQERDKLIASIGPFWDANETWLVLAIGLILIAFPQAHNIILRELYIPATIMLVGLILRGVAFDFRAKAVVRHRFSWDMCFKIGSLIAAFSQGFMLGRYVMGFTHDFASYAFASLSGLCVTAAYALIGGAWLVMKTEGDLQRRVARWSRYCAVLTALGILSVCIVHPYVNEHVFNKWFSFPEIFILLPIPIVCFTLLVVVDRFLKNFPHHSDKNCWLPFAAVCGVFFLCFQALAYSFFPYIVPSQMTLWEAASATESLMFTFWGAIFVVPVILLYTIFSYRVFWGKVGELKYY